jgi:hypothetical protein
MGRDSVGEAAMWFSILDECEVSDGFRPEKRVVIVIENDTDICDDCANVSFDPAVGFTVWWRASVLSAC